MELKGRAFLAAAALALLPLVATGANAATSVVTERASLGLSTPFDSAIDHMVAYRTSRDQLSPAQAAVVREQMQAQFSSLPAAAQAKLLDAAASINSPEAAGQLVAALNGAVADSARASMAATITPKLGTDGDLVYYPTAGPCRVADSRFWFGPLSPSQAQQVYVYSVNTTYPWSDQGGTGQAQTGNCVGDYFPGTAPQAVVAIVTVVNTAGTGALQAWNGGPTLSGGAVLNWTAGQRLSNTTVIPVDRSASAFPNSGFKRDIAVNNNSTGTVDFVVDVVGFFAVNQATPLDCTTVADTNFSLGAGASTLRTAPACPTGYTRIMGQPVTNVFGVYTGTILQDSCRINNATGATVGNLACNQLCCRIPGR